MAPHAKTLGPTLPLPSTLLRPPLHRKHRCHLGPAGILGANPNPRSSPELPFPRGLVPQCWGLGTTDPQCQTHPVARTTPGPLGAPLIIQAGSTSRALRAPRDNQRPHGTKPLGQSSCSYRPQWGPLLARHTAISSVLLASCGLPLILRHPPRGSSQGPWGHKAGDWGPPRTRA